jgi:PTH1 family peptidyl-tRNA hydrolase
MESLRLMVGLGNPGAEYTRTRHNVGFLALEELASVDRASWNHEKKFEARVAKIKLGAAQVLLAQPQTYMNASGQAVGALLKFYHASPSQVLIIVDDADLPFGEVRLRAKGSSGGHHGLESIERHLGTRDFARLKVGIGRNEDGRREITNYVLGNFGPEESGLLRKVLQHTARQAECWAAEGIAKAMNLFNGVVNSGKKET